MSKKKNLAVLFGGKSPEHFLSIESALLILTFCDFEKYNIHAVYIKNNGEFATPPETFNKISESIEKKLTPSLDNNENLENYYSRLKKYAFYNGNQSDLNSFLNNAVEKKYDIVFPVFQGENGEDGTIQGMLDFLNIAFAGCGLSGSAIAIDKELTKRLCKESSINSADFISFRQDEWKLKKEEILNLCEKRIGYTAFVKPSKLGSSVGISRVNNKVELIKGIETALLYNDKIIVEKGINAKEYAVGVIGNEILEVSDICEFMSEDGFLDFDSKYGAKAMDDIIPARLSKEIEAKTKEMAKFVYKKMEIDGMARLDFFIDDENIYLNEINTIPGMGSHSVFMKMWESCGVSKKDLINKIIELGFQRKERKDKFCYKI